MFIDRCARGEDAPGNRPGATALVRQPGHDLELAVVVDPQAHGQLAATEVPRAHCHPESVARRSCAMPVNGPLHGLQGLFART